MKKQKVNKQEVVLLSFIFFLSAVLRFVHLPSFLPGFHFDEVNAGYNAYSLLKTGKTVRGESWPLYLDTFGDFRPMGIVYLILPSVALFGLTEFAVRFPIALIGACSPILLYLLSKKITEAKNISALSALFLTLSPWHINLSRATSETVLAVFFAMLILLILWSFIQEGGVKKAALLYFLFLISFITYHPINLFLPLFLLTTLFIFREQLSADSKKRKLVVGVLVLYIIFPHSTGTLLGEATGRFRQVAEIYSHEFQDHLLRQVVEHRNLAPIFLVRTFHNKLINAAVSMGERYVDYFSGRFLLFKGGLPHRYLIPDVGLLNIVEFVGLLLFILYSLKFRKNSAVLVMISWLLISILPAAITSDDHPNMSRAVLMLPAIEFLSAYAIVSLARRVNKKAVYVFTGAALLIGVGHLFYFFDQYFIHQRSHEWLHRNFVAREAAKELQKIDQTKKVLATNYFLETDTYYFSRRSILG